MTSAAAWSGRGVPRPRRGGSGPAGGVVGRRRTAQAAGARPCSASTWAAPPPTSAATPATWSGATRAMSPGSRLRSPMLDVETVAAGGGSILSFDGLRARVGPPAPAPIRPGRLWRGGPADRHRRQPGAGPPRPALFPRSSAPATTAAGPAAARGRLPDLADAMGARAWRRPRGLPRHAPSKQMAQAVRRISTERGFDPREHALVAFGGAAGQIACQVADALGSARCSAPLRQRALGLGHRPGPGRAMRQAGVEAPLDAAGMARPSASVERRPRPRAHRESAASAGGTPRACATTAPTPSLRSGSTTRRRPSLRGRPPAPVRLHRAGPPIIIAAVEVEATLPICGCAQAMRTRVSGPSSAGS
jgi:5-oxoprolinase (ATP-hydrolysing)